MTLPLLSDAVVDETSPSSSDATPGVYTPLSGLNSFLHGEDSDGSSSGAAPPLASEDPQHLDVSFAHALVNSFLRTSMSESENGGGIPHDKSDTHPDSILRYLRDLNDRKITYQETKEAMTSDRCDSSLHAAEMASIEKHSVMSVGADGNAQAAHERQYLSELLTAANSLDKQMGTHETTGADFRCDYHKLPELSIPAAPVSAQDRPTDSPTEVAFNLVMSLFKKTWAAMDSGAMKHLFDDSIALENERSPMPGETMMSASGHVIRPSKVGDFQLQAKDPVTGESLGHITLNDVSALKNSPLNLISVSMLVEQGSRVNFEKGNSYLEWKGKRLPLVERNGVYLVNLTDFVAADTALGLMDQDHEYDSIEYNGVACPVVSDMQLLHERLGHQKGIDVKFLIDHDVVRGIKLRNTAKASCTKHDPCHKDNCLTCSRFVPKAKHVNSTREASPTAKQIGDIVSIDIFGEMPESILGGYKYGLCCIDQYSRFSVVFYLKTKETEEILECLDSLIRIYARHNHLIKCIQSDNDPSFGGFYDQANYDTSGNADADGATPVVDRNSVFDKFLHKRGIHHRLSPVYVPQLNGVVESAIGSIKKRANSMLYAARLHGSLWPFAVHHSNWLRVRLPVKGFLDEITPWELFTNQKPDFTYLRCFGADCYEAIPADRKSSDDKFSKTKNLLGTVKTRRWLYIGFSEDRIGMRVFDPETREVATRWHLTFNEQAMRQRTSRLREFDDQMEAYKKGRWQTLHPLIADDYDMFNATPEALHSALRFRSIFQDHTRRSVPKKPVGSNFEPDSAGAVDQVHCRQEAAEPAAGSAGGEEWPEPHQALPDEGHDDLIPDILHMSKAKESNLEEKENFEDPNSVLQADELSPLDIDSAAEVSGPLSELSLKRDKAMRDMHLLSSGRPIRYLSSHPAGKELKHITAEDKAFVRKAHDENFKVEFHPSPWTAFNLKKAGTDSHERYAAYSKATTLQEVLVIAQTTKRGHGGRKGSAITSKAWADIWSDYKFGLITFPGNEPTHPDHFVDSQDLADRHGVPVCCNVLSFDAHDPTTVINSYRHERFVDSVMANPFSCLMQSLSDMAGPEDKDTDELSVIMSSVMTDHTTKEPVLGTDRKTLPPYPEGYNPLEDEAFVNAEDPDGYRGVKKLPELHQRPYHEAIEAEWDGLIGIGTFQVVPVSQADGSQTFGCRWVLKKKKGSDGKISKVKARLVCQGFSQIESIHYEPDQLYASVMSYNTFRMLLSICCAEGLQLHQRDVSQAFVQASLDRPLYMRLPEHYKCPGYVLRLIRSLYGTKQAAFLWSQCLRTHLESHGFKRLISDGSVYVKEWTTEPTPAAHPRAQESQAESTIREPVPGVGSRPPQSTTTQHKLIVATYVDDLTVLSTDDQATRHFDTIMESRFPMQPTEARQVSEAMNSKGWILGSEIRYDQELGILEINQRQAIESLAEKYGLTELSKYPSEPMKMSDKLAPVEAPEMPYEEYLSIVGSLLHICNVTRSDCMFAVGFLARHGSRPSLNHFEAAKNVVAFLYNTKHRAVQYVRDASMAKGRIPYASQDLANRLRMFVDADFAGTVASARSTSGRVAFMNQGVVSAKSQLQKLVALSTSEAETIALCESIKDALSLKLLCEELCLRPESELVPIHEDNVSCREMAMNDKAYDKARHFKTRVAFNQHHCRGDDRTIDLLMTPTHLMVADGYTKALEGQSFINFMEWVTSESFFDKSSQSVHAQVSERAGEQKSHNAQPVSQSTPVITGSLIDRLHAGTVFGGMGTTNTPTTVQVPLASNASSTPDAEHRKFQEYCCALLNSSPYTRDGDVGK